MKTLNPPDSMSLQFAMKGIYREENVLSFIKDLPNLRFESQQRFPQPKVQRNIFDIFKKKC